MLSWRGATWQLRIRAVTLACSNRRYSFRFREPLMIGPVAQPGSSPLSSRTNKTKRREHEHDYHQRRHYDLLQGLGYRTADHVFAWLAFDGGCLGRADAVFWPTGLSCYRT